MTRLLLVGAGHAHAQVLLDWVRAPLPGVELVLVSPAALAPYSGMVPGWLAGHYAFEDICIDFHALAAAAGARLVHDELVALDAPRREARLATGTVLGYDVLSLNIGSTLTPPDVGPGRERAVLSLRPLGHLHAAWAQQLAALAAQPIDAPLAVTAVGGGAAGFEALLAVLARLRALQPGRAVQGRLVTRSAALLPGLAAGAVRAAGRALLAAGVDVRLGTAWGDSIGRHSQLVLWATGAEAHAWQRDVQRRGGLAVSERGFITVDTQLRSVSHPQVHAVGDCAEWATPLPKAGVYAVRMGPVLSRNLCAALGHGTAAAYTPQHRYLALLATADGRAIGSRGRWSAQGRWLWRWKDHIDRGFLRRFAQPKPP
jgi:pyridine nucleotide-disulfide oxidoreductase family protein